MYKYCFIAVMSLLTISAISQTKSLPLCANHFVVIAHRGDHVSAPENTLMAYQHAINLGVDYVEIDLRTTKDSVLVIMHDSKIDRMTNGTGYISNFTFDSLRQFKVRNLKEPNFGSHQIPSFDEVLTLCKGKINIYLDFKDASVATTFKKIREAGMEHQIVVYINTLNQLREWKSIAPEMPLIVSLPKQIKTETDMVAFLKNSTIDILDGGYEEYNLETVLGANKQHIPIWADIQSANESSNWSKAIELGLKGLQTDHPKDLIDFLSANHLR